MSASLVGSEMCIRDRSLAGECHRACEREHELWEEFVSLPMSEARGERGSALLTEAAGWRANARWYWWELERAIQWLPFVLRAYAIRPAPPSRL
eukprot:12410693-Alexandrium_andersonii.AAC.1